MSNDYAIIEFRYHNFLYAVLPDPFFLLYSNRGLKCETRGVTKF